MTDQQIISLFQARDESAVSALSEKYRRTCMNIARRHLRSDQDAEECVNDVMLKLWQSIPPAEPRSLEAFIVTVTQRTAINMAEHLQAQKRGGGLVPASLDEITEAVPAQNTVEDALTQRMLTEAVERFLDTLSEDAQTIFVERYHNETAPRDIAEKFGLTGIHVRKSLMQTRRKLKRFLTEEGLL
ncbi:MAG: RNA polymerase sigma factor [Oscillospiraceae bacterium]|nr:RNA polymerase sigma factor [Oscillospiraceae bacterium]